MPSRRRLVAVLFFTPLEIEIEILLFKRASEFSHSLDPFETLPVDRDSRMGLEGIVSERIDAPYRSGPGDVLGEDEEPRLAGRCRGLMTSCRGHGLNRIPFASPLDFPRQL
jgi:hypothetical protein